MCCHAQHQVRTNLGTLVAETSSEVLAEDRLGIYKHETEQYLQRRSPRVFRTLPDSNIRTNSEGDLLGLLRLKELHLGLQSSSLFGLDPLLVRPGILLLELQFPPPEQQARSQ